MLFFKRLILGITAIILIYFGGNGTQSNSAFVQGSGLVGLIIGLVVLYLFAKMIWKVMGCLPVILMICIVVGFILYAIGGFEGGVGNLVPNVKNFFGIEQENSVNAVIENTQEPEEKIAPPQPDIHQKQEIPAITENFDDIGTAETLEINSIEIASDISDDVPAFPEPRRVIRQPQQIEETSKNNGGISNFFSGLMGKKNTPKVPERFNPNEYPAMYGVARVVDGDTLQMGDFYIHIYGIDAPEPKQTCSDNRGRAYRCGQEAIQWLKSWITGHELECHILQQDSKGNMVATCALGQYDIGAAMVNAGWAVADTRQSKIYVPYQYQAKENKNGLWQGQFYTPWDWREIQSAKPKIKIIKPKRPKKGLLDL